MKYKLVYLQDEFELELDNTCFVNRYKGIKYPKVQPRTVHFVMQSKDSYNRALNSGNQKELSSKI